MTSEMQPDQYIEKFVSGGPKNYAYVMVDRAKGCRKTVYKVRGITLNYSVSQLLNFDLIKNMVLDADETATATVHTDKKIKRKREGGRFHIVTEPEDKIYRVCFLKRRRLQDNTSVPFGYI
jgi:hypothetical protein